MQQTNNNTKGLTQEQLIAMANAKAEEFNKASQMEEKKKGLSFMGSQFTIIDKRHELLIAKIITPTESLLLEKIQLGTAGARNGKSTISSEAEFFLNDLADLLHIRINKIYVQLKSLHSKDLIIRKSTRSKGREILGLNPKKFGQILIDSQHEIEKRRHLRLVPNQDQSNPESGLDESNNGINMVPNQDQNEHEKTALDSFRPYIDPFRGSEGGESCTPLGQSETKTAARKRQLSDPQKERARQLQEFRQAQQAGLI
jgi:hypothetical protein